MSGSSWVGYVFVFLKLKDGRIRSEIVVYGHYMCLEYIRTCYKNKLDRNKEERGGVRDWKPILYICNAAIH